MRHKVTELRQEIFNHNEHEVSKRWAFEEGVCICVHAKNILIIHNFVQYFDIISMHRLVFEQFGIP